MTISAQINQKVKLSVKNRFEMDQQLQSNAALLVEQALLCRDRGILVTRLSQCDFTLELNGGVPFGETKEVDRS
jgi:hypothetical protein